MAGKLTSVAYDSLVQRLERMADGIIRHKTEDGFPKRLDDVKRHAMRQELEDLREKYEVTAKEAQKAHDLYFASFKNAETVLAQDDESVRGFYGKKSLTVADFGTKILAQRQSHKAAAPQPAK